MADFYQTIPGFFWSGGHDECCYPNKPPKAGRLPVRVQDSCGPVPDAASAGLWEDDGPCFILPTRFSNLRNSTRSRKHPPSLPSRPPVCAASELSGRRTAPGSWRVSSTSAPQPPSARACPSRFLSLSDRAATARRWRAAPLRTRGDGRRRLNSARHRVSHRVRAQCGKSLAATIHCRLPASFARTRQAVQHEHASVP